MKGKKFLKSAIDNAPENPGIYKISNSQKEIIYIGKAKNLKNRLQQYLPSNSLKNNLIQAEIAFIDYEITDSESNALILESDLVRIFKPKYNILLKDDKSFPYIKLDVENPFPQFKKHRGRDFSKGIFFGPFVSASKLALVLRELQKLFKLRTCTDDFFQSRTKPCIQYFINMCYAPCVKKITHNDYNILVNQVKSFFLGQNNILQKILTKQMNLLSSQLKFEEALIARDKIKALNEIQCESKKRQFKLINSDIVVLLSHNNLIFIQISIYRNNRIFGSKSYIYEINNDLEESILASFLIQFYKKYLLPQEIITNIKISDSNLIEQALYKLKNTKCRILNPKSIHVQEIINNLILTAKISIEHYIKRNTQHYQNFLRIKELFGLVNLPKRIEIYDNSHLFGEFSVGVMVVVTTSGFDKSQYRIFNIKKDKNFKPGDDLYMLEHVLRRRFNKNKMDLSNIADFIIIDGGITHRNLVKKILDELKLDIKFVCMAKGIDRNAGKEKFFSCFMPEFSLDKNLEIMKYLQILRDQAHSFAINSHRKQRNKKMTFSSLDQIESIGKIRKRALLGYFKSFNSLKIASEDEISQVEGISKSLAKKIYGKLHE